MMALNQAAGDDEEKRSEGLGFNPPVYKQRYNAVIALARQLLPKMVIIFVVTNKCFPTEYRLLTWAVVSAS